MEYNGFRDLRVYTLAYELAQRIFQISKRFPQEEKYSLTDQIRRASRSIPANLAEGWPKRRYQRLFVSKMIDCAGEASEVSVWLDFAKDAQYLGTTEHTQLTEGYLQVSRMLHGIITKADKFCF